MRTVASQMADARGQTVSVRLGATSTDGRGRGVRRLRHGDHLPRLPRRLRGGPRRGRGRRTTTSAGCRRCRRATQLDVPRARAAGPRDHAAAALHRGDAGQGARGARHRPPVDLRLDHRARSSTAATSSRRARRSSRRSSPSPSSACSSSTSSSSSTTTSPRGWRTTSTGSPPATSSGSMAAPLLLRHRRRRARAPRAGHRPARRDRRARGQLAPDRQRHRAARRPLRAVSRARRRAGERAGGHGARRADGREGRGAARASRPATACSAPTRAADARSPRETAATARTSPRCCRRARRAKPRTASLFKTMSLETVTLDDALQLLSLPRVVGDGAGRRGDRRPERPLRPVREEGRRDPLARDRGAAVHADARARRRAARAAEGRRGRGQGAASRRCASSGADPASGKPIVVKDGRFGPYVTDGETNASLRRGDDVEALTIERALELLADRRAAGPAKRPSAIAKRNVRVR